LFIFKKDLFEVGFLGGFFEGFFVWFFGGFFIANPAQNTDLLLILKVFDIILIFAGKPCIIMHLLLFLSGPRIFLTSRLSRA